VQGFACYLLAVEVRADPARVGLVWEADVCSGLPVVCCHHLDVEHSHLPSHGASEEIADVSLCPALREAFDHKRASPCLSRSLIKA